MNMNMNDNSVAAIFFICVTIITCVIILTSDNESEHDRRMNLLEEKRRLIQLEQSLDTKLFIDSMRNVIDSEILTFEN